MLPPGASSEALKLLSCDLILPRPPQLFCPGTVGIRVTVFFFLVSSEQTITHTLGEHLKGRMILRLTPLLHHGQPPSFSGAHSRRSPTSGSVKIENVTQYTRNPPTVNPFRPDDDDDREDKRRPAHTGGREPAAGQKENGNQRSRKLALK